VYSKTMTNRKIMFRAWDVESKQYSYSNEMSCGAWGDCILAEAENWEGSYMNKQVLEQYTGLDDKNGVPIYESDLVIINGRKGTVEFGSPDMIPGDIYTESVVWGFYVVSILSEEVIAENPIGCEVIGNIHENPKLLK